jgi:hypothetical protein
MVAAALTASSLLAATADGGLLPAPGLASAEQAAPAGAPGAAAAAATEPREWRSELRGLGRLLALALIRQTPLNLAFSRCLYKVLLAEPITAEDVRRVDPSFAEHRVEAVLRDGGVAVRALAACLLPSRSTASCRVPPAACLPPRAQASRGRQRRRC